MKLKGHDPDYAHAHGTPPTMSRKPTLSSSMAYLLDETVSMASSHSSNADRVDPGHLATGMSSFLGRVHAYRSASLKQNTDLAYYCQLRSLFRVTKLKDRFQSFVAMLADQPTQIEAFIY